MRLMLMLCLLCLADLARADEPDLATIARILDEGMNRSEIPQTAAYLTDRIGGRITNSPAMRAAERWTQAQYRQWGLRNVRAEGFEFGRGWSQEKLHVRMVEPRPLELRAIALAWTPGTQGTVTAPIIVAPMKRERDFAQHTGKLRGKIVLVSRPTAGSEPGEPVFSRYTDEDLARKEPYQQPAFSESQLRQSLEGSRFDSQRDAFLAAEGALAMVVESSDDGGVLHGEGYGYRVGMTPKVPGIELAAEDYRRLARLGKTGAPPTLEITSVVRYHDEDTKAYNILAEIPGRDLRAGYVMAGAHLDSWAAADGAQDNAAGVAAVMEAGRILSKLGLEPRRTIRLALWSAEEQVMGGSMAYVEKYLADRPPVTDPQLQKASVYEAWDTRWPITLKPGAKDLVAYFNVDNGSGKVRGIFTEGNLAIVPIFQSWLEPFASLGANRVVTQHTWGTDHVFLRQVGVPAFQFIQDPLDYNTRIHHTSNDTYDHLRIDDLRQVAVILASMLWMAAERTEPLPRGAVERKPVDADPFAYPEEEE